MALPCIQGGFVIEAEHIARCVAGVLARIEMGMVDPGDWWQMLEAATDEVTSNTTLVVPPGHKHNLLDIFLGSVMTRAHSELEMKRDKGEYSYPVEAVINEE